MWKGAFMLAAWRRIAPFVLAGLLLFNLAEAILDGGRGNWIRVAVIALFLAWTVWLRRRREEEPRNPRRQ